MSEFSSRATLFIDWSGGNYQLKMVDSVGVTFKAATEEVLAIGVLGGAGFRDKEGGGDITLDVYRPDGPQEVPWFLLFQSKEKFQFVIQDKETGLREQYRQCRVGAPPDRKIGTDGSNMETVKIVFLQHGLLSLGTL